MTSKTEQQRKRQAAWATLEPHLSGEDLAAAIRLLDTHSQDSTMASLIRYINEVGKLTGKLDRNTRKSLYPKYYHLLNDRNCILPEDPLPLLNKTKVQISREQLSSPLAEMITTVQSLQTSATSTIPNDPSSPPDFKITGKTEYEQPETAVFDYFMHRLPIRFPGDIASLLNTLKTNAEQDDTLSLQAKDDLGKWIHNNEHPWSSELNESTLASLVQLIYSTLCDALGSTQTDQLFLQLFSDCDDIPESRQFPPTLFL